LLNGFSIYYFYHRLSDYGTLTSEVEFLSAPNPKAPLLFKESSGQLVKIIREDKALKKWVQAKSSRHKVGWIKSKYFLPLNLDLKKEALQDAFKKK